MRNLRHPVSIVVLTLALCAGTTKLSAQTQVGTAGTTDPVPRLWSDPGAIASRDLYWGMGGELRVPKPPFTFVEEKDGGTQPKIVVTDANGTTWDVKFGPEAHAEVAANRFVHALGYFSEESYFLGAGRIEGVRGLKRADAHVSGAGTFVAARFTRRDPAVVPLEEEWTFHENPFVGTRELSGLVILMTILNNWDIRGPANNDVVRVTRPDGAQERRYLVGDLGGTFGRMGGPISLRSKWNLADYRAEGFIEKVEEGVVHLDYDGFDSRMDRVPLEHARWFAALVSQLTPEQVRRAFEAAGATPDEVEGFAERFVEKIAQLQAALRVPPAR
jgi:hypothetical protein